MTRSERSKPCRLCHQSKPLNEFYKAQNAKDGRRSECRSCHRNAVRQSEARRGGKKKRLARNREWYRTHRAYFAEHKRRYYREHCDEIKAYFKKYYDEHKDYFRRKKREYRNDKKKLAHMRAYNKAWSRRWRAKVKRERARLEK